MEFPIEIQKFPGAARFCFCLVSQAPEQAHGNRKVTLLAANCMLSLLSLSLAVQDHPGQVARCDGGTPLQSRFHPKRCESMHRGAEAFFCVISFKRKSATAAKIPEVCYAVPCRADFVRF